MAYKHKIVQGIADLVEEHKDKAIEGIGEFMNKDLIWRGIWLGVKRQVPSLLQNQILIALRALDENEEAVATLREKLIEVLDLKPQNEEELEEELREPKFRELTVTESQLAKAGISTEPEVVTEVAEEVAELEIGIEPAEEKKESNED